MRRTRSEDCAKFGTAFANACAARGCANGNGMRRTGMKLSAKDAFQLLKTSAKDFGEDECPTRAAALAYSTVFALPPLLILILMLVSAFVSRETVQSAMSGEVGRMIGADGAKMVQTMITQAKQP